TAAAGGIVKISSTLCLRFGIDAIPNRFAFTRLLGLHSGQHRDDQDGQGHRHQEKLLLHPNPFGTRALVIAAATASYRCERTRTTLQLCEVCERRPRSANAARHARAANERTGRLPARNDSSVRS